MTLTVSIPSKLMLAGEYAVLFPEGKSLSFALDPRMKIHFKLFDSPGTLKLVSNLWEKPILLDMNENEKDYFNNPFIHGVLHGINWLEIDRSRGLHIEVESKIDVSYGFGSSSALRLGILYGLVQFEKWISENSMSPNFHWSSISESESSIALEKSYLLQKLFQDKASGYDFITQFYGGAVICKPFSADQSWPAQVQKIPSIQKGIEQFIHIFVGGKGADTKSTLHNTLSIIEDSIPISQFLELSERLVQTFIKYLLDLDDVNKKINQDLFDEVKFHRSILKKAQREQFFFLLSELQNIPGCDKNWSFKTTGAGGEDALILIGQKEPLIPAMNFLNSSGWFLLSTKYSQDGIRSVK